MIIRILPLLTDRAVANNKIIQARTLQNIKGQFSNNLSFQILPMHYKTMNIIIIGHKVSNIIVTNNRKIK